MIHGATPESGRRTCKVVATVVKFEHIHHRRRRLIGNRRHAEAEIPYLTLEPIGGFHA